MFQVQSPAMAFASDVVVPTYMESICPRVKVLPEVRVVVPTVLEATKYEGVVAAPATSGSMPKNDLVVEA